MTVALAVNPVVFSTPGMAVVASPQLVMHVVDISSIVPIVPCPLDLPISAPSKTAVKNYSKMVRDFTDWTEIRVTLSSTTLPPNFFGVHNRNQDDSGGYISSLNRILGKTAEYNKTMGYLQLEAEVMIFWLLNQLHRAEPLLSAVDVLAHLGQRSSILSEGQRVGGRIFNFFRTLGINSIGRLEVILKLTEALQQFLPVIFSSLDQSRTDPSISTRSRLKSLKLIFSPHSDAWFMRQCLTSYSSIKTHPGLRGALSSS